MIKLLIVDDERTIRNGLARHMDWEKLGIGMVESAGSAEEAFAQCEKIRPDILLSDIRMRGMGGVEMCTQGGSGRDGCREPRHGGENRAARAGAQRLSREFREMP